MDLHQNLRQEHLRTQRAAQAAWVAEQAQQSNNRTAEPSQAASANLHNYRDPDITARNPPITNQEHLRKLTPAQFEQEQKAILLAMQSQPRRSPTPAPKAVPGLHACRLAGQASRSARPLSSLERDFLAGDRCKVEWLFTKFYWIHIWRTIWAIDMMVGQTPATQWGLFMSFVFILMILLIPYFAMDTVWLLTTLAFHVIK